MADSTNPTEEGELPDFTNPFMIDLLNIPIPARDVDFFNPAAQHIIDPIDPIKNPINNHISNPIPAEVGNPLTRAEPSVVKPNGNNINKLPQNMPQALRMISQLRELNTEAERITRERQLANERSDRLNATYERLWDQMISVSREVLPRPPSPFRGLTRLTADQQARFSADKDLEHHILADQAEIFASESQQLADDLELLDGEARVIGEQIEAVLRSRDEVMARLRD